MEILSYTKFKNGTPLQVQTYWSEEWASWGTMLCNRNGWQIRDAEWNGTDEGMEKAHRSLVEDARKELCSHCDGEAQEAYECICIRES